MAEHWNSELALALEVGPLDMRRGVNTEVKPSKVPENPLPLLHGPGDGRASADGVEPELDEDEKDPRICPTTSPRRS